jgi:hypothetical protein
MSRALSLRNSWRLLAVTCLAACRSGDVDGPAGPLTGIYVLRSIDGAPLPAFANGAQMTEFRIAADTLRLDESGNGVEVIVRARSGEPVERESVNFKLVRSGRAFRVDYFCPDGGVLASCLAGPHHVGRFTSIGLTFDGSAMYRVPMVYERVTPFVDQYLQGGNP